MSSRSHLRIGFEERSDTAVEDRRENVGLKDWKAHRDIGETRSISVMLCYLSFSNN